MLLQLGKVAQPGLKINKEDDRAGNILLIERARKRNPVLLGGSGSESGMVVKELLRLLGRNLYPDGVIIDLGDLRWLLEGSTSSKMMYLEGVVYAGIGNANLRMPLSLEFPPKPLSSNSYSATLSCPAAVMSMENAEAVRAVAVEKSMELDARLIQGQQDLASVEAEFARISEEEEDLEAQIQCLIAEKRELMNLG
ncbi:hypothetical protein LINPERHAP1_LOCUS31947 [Linum perenne]